MSNTDESFPSSLLALTDAELSALMIASRPLQPGDRGAFLQTVAAGLQTLPEVGPGALHRLLAEAQAAFPSWPGTRRNGRHHKDDVGDGKSAGNPRAGQATDARVRLQARKAAARARV